MRIDINNLTQGYGKRKILDDITFSVESGEVVGLLGPNGSGKSTLIKSICNILDPWSGDISIDGTDIKKLDVTDIAKMISYVPQNASSTVYTSVIDTVLLGRRPYISWSYRDKDIDMAIDAMTSMKVEQYSSANVSELSGGQRQRVFIARSLVQEPVFFLLDEPTSALDLKHQMNTMITMRQISREKGAGVIVALHDINLAMNYTDRVIMLKDGKIFADGPPHEVLNMENISMVYGVKSTITEAEGCRFILPLTPDSVNTADD